MPVAERLYYEDSFLQSFTTRVTDIREYARANGQSQWQIALERTAFYPTSGGQPHDRGQLTATARSGAELVAEIGEVVEDEGGEVWHSTRKPLLPDTEVTGTVDWPRRLDHMQQHSGQHLLSAVFVAKLGASTLSFHLGETACSIDLAVEGTEQQNVILAGLASIERLVNEHIAENLPVSVRTVGAEQAQALLAEGKVCKLPPRAGPIRLVEIPGLDLNACGGTHVRALGQIGSVLLRSFERFKKSVRVEFVCGLRAVQLARQDYTSLSSAAAALSVGRGSVAGAVERLLAENKGAAKAQQRLREELAHHQAVQLAVEHRIEQGLRLVERSFADRDAEYVKLLATQLVTIVPQTVVILLATRQEPATLILACSHSLSCGCGERLRKALEPLGLRGGGSPDMAHIQLPRVQAEQVAAQIAKELAGELRAKLESSPLRLAEQ